MINKQLLCTFSNSKDFKKISEAIFKFYKIINDKIFVFSNLKSPKDVYLTYNVINSKSDSKFPNTILIHRKKETNTMYSLNAMNVLIREENGELDKSFQLDWSLYHNSLIITGDISVRIIPLDLISVEYKNPIK